VPRGVSESAQACRGRPGRAFYTRWVCDKTELNQPKDQAMAQATIKNQMRIIANQNRIIRNQDRLAQIVANQVKIIRNQQAIIKNQKKIIAARAKGRSK
jgi:hypothetical protein